MKVLLPINTSHSIVIYPRFYPSGALSMKIVKDGTKVTATVTPTYSVTEGIMTVNFTLVGVEQDRFTFKLTEGSNVVYIGKLFFTSQNTQDFKLNKDTYIYVD
jgi:hypothetical protein